MVNADVVVLGAGMVGVSIAVHLAKRGRSVVLVDRNPGAGEGTSYGNAGIIERSSILPYMFPRDIGQIVKYALNQQPEAYYQLSSLHKVAPWLVRYWLNSTPRRKAEIAAANLPLIENSLAEHQALAREAGVSVALRPDGWLKLFRTQQKLDEALGEIAVFRTHGLAVDPLDPAQVQALEPHLTGAIVGGVHMRNPASVADPEGLAKSYEGLFEKLGGRYLQGDARTLRQQGEGWTLETVAGPLTVRDVAVAMGPWSSDIFEPLGYAIPLGVKRGYHLHFTAKGNAVLHRPVLDVDGGYVLAPMAKGIRLTTGAEFAVRDAAPSTVPISRTEPLARAFFPLDARVEKEPWLGRRPALPDMTPVIGPASRHRGLWFAFGHHHHGLTNGPVTGRLLAELITGETPFIDPTPYRVDRF